MFELLSATVKNKVDNITNKTNSTDVISKEDLDEMLLKINSFNFVVPYLVMLKNLTINMISMTKIKLIIHFYIMILICSKVSI